MAKSKISKKKLTITKTLDKINMDYCDERDITEWIERFTALRDTVDKDGHKYERVTVYWDYDRWSDSDLREWMVVTGYREETDDEYNLRMEAELEERKKVNLKKREEKKAREDAERKEYERLKAKYGE